MIVPDVNVLVHAYHRDAAKHERYAEWLADVVAGQEELGLVEAALTGFLRVVTHPRIYADPAPSTEALVFVATLRGGRQARTLAATEATWQHFADIAAADRQVRGVLVPDAWLAAMARSHGGRLATADRGFARFPGLRWFDPVA
ncbi:MAG TPA: TA system VapC family ribonuclease toxin [Pseudonocardia sp.]|nr:TA system VapC family ribonuclease toxin [Pseudonocardia sp.]